MTIRITFLFAFLAFCTPTITVADTPTRGGAIKVAINSDIRSTNPGVRRDGNTDTVLYHVVEALVAFRKDLTPGPMLAESYSVSPDGKAYHFKLRQGVLFHNGIEMTSEHVVWSWNRILDPATGYRCISDFNGTSPSGFRIESIEAEGTYAVTFKLNQPSSMFLHRMASIQCFTAILHPSSLDGAGNWVKPVATGPYQIDDWKLGQSVTLSRFEDYVSRTDEPNGLTGRKTAYFDEVMFQVVPDRIAAKASIYAGNIDLVFALPLSAVKEVERRAKNKGDVKVYHQDTLDWTVLLIQNSDPLFENPKMRRALAHAISQDMVSTFAAFGYAGGNPSAVAAISPYHKGLSDVWPGYDPKKARMLAKEAGYNGEAIVIQTNRKYSYMFDNAVAIQAMLHAAGFNARLEVYDWATQLTNFFKGQFQLSSFGYSARSHPALVFGNIVGTKTTRASAQWDDAMAKKLVANLETATSEEAMQQAVNTLHAYMAEEIPIIGLYNDHLVDLSSASIKGYRPWPFARPRLWNVWREEVAE